MVKKTNVTNVDYELQDFMEVMEEIRSKFIRTDGGEWGPKKLREHVESLDNHMKSKLLVHMITIEWMRFVDKDQLQAEGHRDATE